MLQPVNTRAATIGAAWIPGFSDIHMSSNLYHDLRPLRCSDRHRNSLSIATPVVSRPGAISAAGFSTK
jgi:hypothetical protein